MEWFKKLSERTKEVASMYTGTFVVVMILNQLLFFGFCLNPVCLIAAMPHVLLITVVIGTWLNKDNFTVTKQGDGIPNISKQIISKEDKLILLKEYEKLPETPNFKSLAKVKFIGQYEKSLFPGYFSKLFNVTKHKEINLDKTKLSSHTKNGRNNLIELSGIDDVSLSEGIIWSGLQITLNTGENINFTGLPKKHSRKFHELLSRSLSEIYYYDMLLNACEAFHSYPEKGHYFKKITLDKVLIEVSRFSNAFKYLDRPPEDPVCNNVFDFVVLVESETELVRGKHNHIFMQDEKNKYRSFFASVEKKPLTERQVEACIINETANLVIAGAGSGKTSVMVAKAGYLIKKGLASEDEILLVAFNKLAATELKERIYEKLQLENIQAKTFHALGLDIIAKSTSKKPSLAPWEQSALALEKLIWGIIEEQVTDTELYAKLLKFFVYHISTYKSDFDFEDAVEYNKYIYDSNLLPIRESLITLKNAERVKSFEELEIANFLFINRIDYEYERSYELDTATEQYGQYHPDFYLPEYETYLEHFGIDKQGNTAPFIDKEKYNKGIEWKRNLHKENDTKLIETYSWMRSEGHLLESLERILKGNNIVLNPMPYEEALLQLKDSGRVSIFASTMATFINHVRSNKHSFDTLRERATRDERSQLFIDIAEPTLERYEQVKKEKGVIDFNDMIELATNYVNSGKYRSPYKFILADEFQDISVARAELIQALLKQKDDYVLTAVGDDWQSINRFAGSDISIFRDFSEFFGYSEVVKLDYSFRYSDKISAVSQRFVETNPSQIKKEIKTLVKAVEKPVLLFWDVNDIHKTVDNILRRITEKQEDASVLILARYKFKLLENFKTLQDKHTSLSIRQMTVHGSKGLEADFVIILGLEGGKYGFPSNIEDDPVIDLVLSDGEEFEQAEERRLFYVALTRAKKTIFILGDQSNASPFSKEILSDQYEEEVLHVTPNKMFPEQCPNCTSGMLIIRQGNHGLFYGCSNFKSGCSYTKQVNSCPECFVGIIQTDKTTGEHSCHLCDFSPRICIRCGGFMNLKKGKNGDFYGCSNYSKNACRHTENA